MLDQAAAAGAFERLILVAPPRTLGDLRAALAAATRKRVTGELDKDLTQVSLGEMPEHLGALLAL